MKMITVSVWYWSVGRNWHVLRRPIIFVLSWANWEIRLSNRRALISTLVRIGLFLLLPLPNCAVRGVEKLLEVRRINYRRELYKLPETHHSFPATELTYLGNVMNDRAYSFYQNHGVQRIAPAFEKVSADNAVLMFCKHCLRYSMGWCPTYHKVRSPYKEPYYLVSADGKRFVWSLIANIVK